jgi:hypothetical protein
MQVARFIPNPEAYWGPKPKAGRPQKVWPHLSQIAPISMHIVFGGPSLHFPNAQELASDIKRVLVIAA